MVKSRDFNCEGIKRDEKTFDTKADGSVFTSAKEKPPIPEAEPLVFTSGWILMKPQTSPERRMKRRTILKTDEDAKRKNLGVQVPKGVFIDYGSIRSKFLQNVLILLRIGRFRGSLFPRLFALELDKEIVVANKMGASSAHPQLLFAGLLDGS
ncbi:hypothetical protein Tco_0278087 [Tanacetum coccineum]